MESKKSCIFCGAPGGGAGATTDDDETDVGTLDEAGFASSAFTVGAAHT
jgi:hypothetical protein